MQAGKYATRKLKMAYSPRMLEKNLRQEYTNVPLYNDGMYNYRATSYMYQ